jgi:hypothetical protein
MRLLPGLFAVAYFAIAAADAQAVGRAPGGTLKWLGWGYGHGFHAPIAHAYPPVSRFFHHAPGGHFFGPHHPGHCHAGHGGGCPHMGYGYGPCMGHCGPYAAPMGPEAYPEPVEVVPGAAEADEPLPEAPTPPPLQTR